MPSRVAVAVLLALAALVVSACTLPLHVYYSIDGTPHVLHDVHTVWDAPQATPTVEAYPTPTPTPAPPPAACTAVVTTIGARLNVRSGPGLGYPTVTLEGLQPGAVVTVIGSAAGWYQISDPSGWVSGQWVRLDEVAACGPFVGP